jgi:hypothetical protein
VRRPRDIVPTNLVMLIGDTILSEGLLLWNLDAVYVVTQGACWQMEFKWVA